MKRELPTVSLAKQIRIDALRMTSACRGPHLGAVFSCADILAVLYGSVLRVDPKEPRRSDRDRFILSKGHAAAGLYAVLAETGFFPKEKLATFHQDGSDLGGHVSHRGVPGVEVSTGSLGHGLCIGVGMAFSAKLDSAAHRVIVLLGDGECDEGAVWEAAMFAAHHNLDNLTAIIDYNKLQSFGTVVKTLGLEPLADKWRSFGWTVRETDGHDHGALRRALERNSRPTCVIAHTTKGKGVSFMENDLRWHYYSPQGKELEAARRELEDA